MFVRYHIFESLYMHGINRCQNQIYVCEWNNSLHKVGSLIT